MLSKTSRYALRTLAELAGLKDGESVLSRDLSERIGAPPQYLSKVLVTLRRAGLVRATRGQRGGYCLGRPAGTVRLIQVVELTEGPMLVPRCLLDNVTECGSETACRAHEGWFRVQEMFVEFLSTTTIADIAREGGSV